MELDFLKFLFTGFIPKIDFAVVSVALVAARCNLIQPLLMSVNIISFIIIADGKLNCRLTIFQRCFRAPQKAEDLFTELRKIADQYPREAIIIKIEDYIFFNTSNENGTSKYSMQ